MTCKIQSPQQHFPFYLQPSFYKTTMYFENFSENMSLSWNPGCIYSNIIKLTWKSKCPGKLYSWGGFIQLPCVPPLSLPQALRRAGSSSGSSFLACAHLLRYFFSRFPRLSRVPAAEDLASRMLTAFPRGRISAQDALLHGFFSPLPPQLYQISAGKLTLDFISPRESYFTCHLLWVSSVLWKSL